jgi:hypothetical protein
MKSDSERRNAIMANPLEGALFTFHNGTVGDYQKRTGELPAMLLQLKTGMQPHLTELHNDRNLLFSRYRGSCKNYRARMHFNECYVDEYY